MDVSNCRRLAPISSAWRRLLSRNDALIQTIRGTDSELKCEIGPLLRCARATEATIRTDHRRRAKCFAADVKAALRALFLKQISRQALHGRGAFDRPIAVRRKETFPPTRSGGKVAAQFSSAAARPTLARLCVACVKCAATRPDRLGLSPHLFRFDRPWRADS